MYIVLVGLPLFLLLIFLLLELGKMNVDTVGVVYTSVVSVLLFTTFFHPHGSVFLSLLHEPPICNVYLVACNGWCKACLPCMHSHM